MYMEDIKLFDKSEKLIETIIQAVRICCQDIGVAFGKEKFTMLTMNSGKRHLTDRREWANQEKIRTLGEKETYKFLGIMEADPIKQEEMKEKKKKNKRKKKEKSQEN